MVKAARAPRLKVVARGGLVVLKQGKGDRSRYVLTFQEMLRMAFAKRRCRNAAADAYAVSQRTVRRVLAVTAHCILETQMSQMKEFERYVLSHTPDFAAAVVMWDETSEKLSLNAHCPVPAGFHLAGFGISCASNSRVDQWCEAIP